MTTPEKRDEKIKRTAVLLRYIKSDAETIPHHIEGIGHFITQFKYQWEDTEELARLEELYAKLHEIEQSLLQLNLDCIARYSK